MGAPSDEARRRDPIRILFCCGPSYFTHLAAAIASLLASNQDEQLEIHLATSLPDLAQEARLARWVEGRGAKLKLHRFDWGATRWHTSFHITQEAYIRLFAPRFLDSTIGKALYLDADLLVLGNLRPLWEIDLTGFAVAASPDPYGQSRRQALGIGLDVPYVNSGVLLMNLDLWREHDLSGRLCAYVEEAGERLLFHDQDALNAVLAGQILPLDYRWNLQAKMLRRRARRRLPEAAAIARAVRAPAILHYTSARKPWLFVMATPAKSLYWRYLRQTPWAATRSPDLRWAKAPEFALNHLLDLAGLDYTWDRVRRATLPGRALDHLLSFLARLTGRAAATGRSSNDRAREGDASEPRGAAARQRPGAGPPDPNLELRS
ncbi:MAG TPA: glycosyltransferase family 8 protein [Caulobacteraceae bacterium]|jgi:lipopolysaccharide biosynthesis glycosyltransferase|nr:glycosyltransferase family 8 protein [Caulobacteraceae bacterium]